MTKVFRKYADKTTFFFDSASVLLLILSLIFLSFGSITLINYFYTISDNYLYGINTFFGLMGEIIIAAIIFPFAEELGFRGFILHKMSKKWSVRNSIIVSSLLFAAIHTPDIFGSFIFAVVMCLLYIKFRTLIVPIIFHMLYNLFLVVYAYGSANLYVVAVPIDEILNNYFLLAILSITSLCYVSFFIYKHWPDSNIILPYQQEKKHSKFL